MYTCLVLIIIIFITTNKKFFPETEYNFLQCSTYTSMTQNKCIIEDEWAKPHTKELVEKFLFVCTCICMSYVYSCKKIFLMKAWCYSYNRGWARKAREDPRWGGGREFPGYMFVCVISQSITICLLVCTYTYRCVLRWYLMVKFIIVCAILILVATEVVSSF